MPRRPTAMRRWLAGLGLFTLGACLDAVQAAPVQATARAGAAPVLDGLLDDLFWQGVPPRASFRQVLPAPGADPTRRTELFVAHDGVTLFLALRAQEADAGAVVAHTLRRDAQTIDSDDHVAIVLDPQGNGRNGFIFRVNALGARRDGLIADGAVTRTDWDGLWQAETRVDAQGWTVEIAIPLADLAAPADGRAWGFNVERYRAATGERVRLFGASPDRTLDSLADAGQLQGVQPVRRGWGLRLQPGVRWSASRSDGQHAPGRWAASLDAGLSLTPTLGATVTLNSDFADAELDDRVVNLTRYELFQPEKRSFFTQDAGRFSFGGLDTEEPLLMPFFSRRIGLGSTIDAGLKVSGTAGPVELGAFAVQVPGRPAARMAVARAAVGLGASQRLGLIATRGTPDGNGRNHLGGLDYQYRSTSFMGDRLLEAHAWALRSHDEAAGSAGAHGASLRFPNVGLTGRFDGYDIDQRFRPALGYVRETGVRIADASLGWHHLGAGGDSLITSAHAGGRRRHDGTEGGHYAGLSLEWLNARGDYLLPELFVEQQTLATPFEPLPGVWLRPGEQRFGYGWLLAGTSPSRAVSAELALRAGGYHEGSLREQTLRLLWRPGPQWSLQPALTRQQLHAHGRGFNALMASLKLAHTPTTRSARHLTLQHDNVSGELLLGVRARWDLAHGQRLQLAMDRASVRAAPAAPRRPTDYRLTASMTWTLAR